MTFSQLFSRLLIYIIPYLPSPFLYLVAKAYIAGKTPEEALTTVARLHEEGLHSTVDVLGEHPKSWAEADTYQVQYEKLIHALANSDHANVSLKLSGLGQLLNEDVCLGKLIELLKLAKTCNVFIRIDMEDSTTTSSTLLTYRTVRSAGFDNCGIVLQSRLFRTEDDLERLADLVANYRLCIGIYREAEKIALQDKNAMKKNLLKLLRKAWSQAAYVAIATHEEWIITAALTLAEEMDIPSSRFEVQMLLGVPRTRLQQDLLRRGVKVRLYVPFGSNWRAYCLRRIANNPDMVGMIISNLLRKK